MAVATLQKWKGTKYIWKGWLQGRGVGDKSTNFDGAIIGPEFTLSIICAD